MLAREQGSEWHVLGGTEGQNFQLGTTLCPADFPLFPPPSWGETPSPPLIYVSTGVQHCFGTNTVPSAKARGF